MDQQRWTRRSAITTNWALRISRAIEHDRSTVTSKLVSCVLYRKFRV